jgi:hypothetical protein
MSGFSRGREHGTQQCIHCGRQIRCNLTQCPYCREAQAERRPLANTRPRTQTNGRFRSGLLLMLLSLAVHYFAGGYSPLVLPGDISSPLLTYLAPLLFVSGLAMSLWSLFLRVRA